MVIEKSAVIPKTLFEAIISAACIYYNISEPELMQRTRNTDRVLKRKIVIYLLRRNTTATKQNISIRFGFTGNTKWIGDVTKEIDCTADVYLEISRDIKNIMNIALS